ncbi:hypothetical protein N9L52_07680 [Litoricolaceae bacterium]|nr:hypothetical protein [Litorivicinaceae bacterium]
MGFLLSLNGFCWADDFVLNGIFDPLRTIRFVGFTPSFQSDNAKCLGDNACSMSSTIDLDKRLDYSNTDRFFVEGVDRSCVRAVDLGIETNVRGRLISREVSYEATTSPRFVTKTNISRFDDLAVRPSDFIADSWLLRLTSLLSKTPNFFVSAVDGEYQKVFKILGLDGGSKSANLYRLSGVSDLSSINVRFRNIDTGEEFLVENVRPIGNVVDFSTVVTSLGLGPSQHSAVDVYVFTKHNFSGEMLFEGIELETTVLDEVKKRMETRPLSWENDRWVGRLEERDLRFGDSRVSSVHILRDSHCSESKPNVIFGRQWKLDMPAVLSPSIVSFLGKTHSFFWGEFAYRRFTDIVLVDTSKRQFGRRMVNENRSRSVECPTTKSCRLWFFKPERFIVIHNQGRDTVTVACREIGRIGTEIKLLPGSTSFLQEVVDCNIDGNQLELFIGLTSLTHEISAADLMLIPLLDGQRLELPLINELPLIKQSQDYLTQPFVSALHGLALSAPVRSFSASASDNVTFKYLGGCTKGRIEGSDQMLAIDDGEKCILSGENGGINILRLPVGVLVEASLGYSSPNGRDYNSRGSNATLMPNITKSIDLCVQSQALKNKYLGIEREKRACDEFFEPNVKVTDP